MPADRSPETIPGRLDRRCPSRSWACFASIANSQDHECTRRARSCRAQTTDTPDGQGQSAQCADDCGDPATRADATRWLWIELGANQGGSIILFVPFNDEGDVVRALEAGCILLWEGGLHVG